ncbi:MAG: hypothetical protein IJ071_00495 [Ruminococcus sp.]|nr:hypothetical protein [Ruminococcus sp.]
MKRLFLLLLLIAGLWGILLYKEQVRDKKQKQSEEDIKPQISQYIEEKYGFTPQIKSTVIDSRSGAFNRQYNGKVIAELCYNGRDFLVWIGEDGSDPRDSYQHEEIQAAFLAELQKSTPGIIDAELKCFSDIYSTDYSGFFDCLVRTKFTGDNLFEVLSECYGSYNAYLIGRDITGEKFRSIDPEFYGTYISYYTRSGWEEHPFIDLSTKYSDPETFDKYVKSWCNSERFT